MKTIVVRAVSILALLLMSGVSVSGQSLYSSSPTNSLSLWQAGHAIDNASKYLTVAHWGNWGQMAAQFYSIKPGSIKITAVSLEFDTVNKKGVTKHLQVNVKDLAKVSASCGQMQCVLIPAAGKLAIQDPEAVKDAVPFQLWFGWYPTAGVNVCQRAANKDECMHAANWFAAALNGLHATAVAYSTNPGYFPQQAAAWRALTTKPALAEGARILRLAAEDAIKRQKPDEALNNFELGVEADPT
jgi:hypothetical protein